MLNSFSMCFAGDGTKGNPYNYQEVIDLITNANGNVVSCNIWVKSYLGQYRAYSTVISVDGTKTVEYQYAFLAGTPGLSYSSRNTSQYKTSSFLMIGGDNWLAENPSVSNVIEYNTNAMLLAHCTNYYKSGGQGFNVVLVDDYEIVEENNNGETNDIVINDENFPDKNFQDYLKWQNYGEDGVLTKEEIMDIKEIDVVGRNIYSLKGIEFFTSLERLECARTKLTSLDVTGCVNLVILGCSSTPLVSLDASGCSNLKSLVCQNCQLTSINVSGCTGLQSLNCDHNQLTSLDVSDCTKLSTFQCYNNLLTYLDVSGCTNLNYLPCYENQLKTIDVSNCNNLREIRCHKNNINGAGMDTFINTLPQHDGATIWFRSEAESEGNYCSRSQVATIHAKGWSIMSGAQPYEGIDTESGDEDIVFEGDGTLDCPYIIKTISDLSRLSTFVNSGNSCSGIYFALFDNIDLTDIPFEPIGNQTHPFSGIFDGEGYFIKGMSVNGVSYLGLFGYTEGASINNVGVEDVNLIGTNYIGGIAGYSHNTLITNCYTRGMTVGNDCVGAIVGYSGEGTIVQNCFSSIQHAKSQIYGSVGGLIGYNCGKIENSYFYGTINANVFEKSTTGGIVGYNHTTGSIYYCYFIKYGDFMNGKFDYCGSLNWGNCSGIDTFDLSGITTSGSDLHLLLNTWVTDHSSQGYYRQWTSESFPSFDKYAEPVEPYNKEFVDLGLPSGNLWAKSNIGATFEYEYGNKFAFGEVLTKDQFLQDSYKWLNANNGLYTKYTIDGVADNKYELDSEDDAATHLWGTIWKTPSQTDFFELINYCDSRWEIVNGVSGRRFIGTNGNSIFLPAAGYTYWYNQYLNELGYYMTRQVYSNEKLWLLYFSDSEISTTWTNVKYQGYSVRPVANKKDTSITSLNIEKEGYDDVYGINGIKKESVSRGLNLIRTKEGKTMKVWVK